jgi:hypothetical protein
LAESDFTFSKEKKEKLMKLLQKQAKKHAGTYIDEGKALLLDTV